MAGLIFALYLTGNLGPSFPVPRFIGWVYNLLGIIPGSVIQMVLSLAIIIASLPKKAKKAAANKTTQQQTPTEQI
ncbi:hypothetical protein LJC61_02055 [Ruminococcaceae bacterium OttesenSCG-928-A16]|nr:hypothetical protein [Ruminococcaceae bacterium OttesenSCG-928-A16]